MPSYTHLNTPYTHPHDRPHSAQAGIGGYNLGQAGPGPSSMGSGSGRMLSDTSGSGGYFAHVNALRDTSLSPVNGKCRV
jgi:hypothetical protein